MKYHIVYEPYERYGNATVHYNIVEAESRVDAIPDEILSCYEEGDESKLSYLQRMGSLVIGDNGLWAYWVSDDGESVSIGETKEECGVNFINMMTEFGGMGG